MRCPHEKYYFDNEKLIELLLPKQQKIKIDDSVTIKTIQEYSKNNENTRHRFFGDQMYNMLWYMESDGKISTDIGDPFVVVADSIFEFFTRLRIENSIIHDSKKITHKEKCLLDVCPFMVKAHETLWKELSTILSKELVDYIFEYYKHFVAVQTGTTNDEKKKFHENALTIIGDYDANLTIVLWAMKHVMNCANAQLSFIDKNDCNYAIYTTTKNGVLYWTNAIQKLIAATNDKQIEDVVASNLMVHNEFTFSNIVCIQKCSQAFSHLLWKILANGCHSNPQTALRVAFGFEQEVGIECAKNMFRKISNERHIDMANFGITDDDPF